MTLIPSRLIIVVDLTRTRNRWFDSSLGIQWCRNGFWGGSCFSGLWALFNILLTVSQTCKSWYFYHLKWLSNSLAMNYNSTSSVSHLREDIHAHISFIPRKHWTWRNIIYLDLSLCIHGRRLFIFHSFTMLQLSQDIIFGLQFEL